MNTYVFQNNKRPEDRIAVQVPHIDTDHAYGELWNTIIRVPGLFTSMYKIHSIHKGLPLNQFQFSKIKP